MHSAPAVSYPVGRSRFQAGLLLALGLSGVLSGVLWFDPPGPFSWRHFVFAFLFFAAWLHAVNAWRHSPAGCLRWDGQAWSWKSDQTKPCAALKVHLDLQFFLVVTVVLEDGKCWWLWPERRADELQWTALRRAVFSRSSLKLGPDLLRKR